MSICITNTSGPFTHSIFYHISKGLIFLEAFFFTMKTNMARSWQFTIAVTQKKQINKLKSTKWCKYCTKPEFLSAHKATCAWRTVHKIWPFHFYGRMVKFPMWKADAKRLTSNRQCRCWNSCKQRCEHKHNFAEPQGTSFFIRLSLTSMLWLSCGSSQQTLREREGERERERMCVSQYVCVFQSVQRLQSALKTCFKSTPYWRDAFCNRIIGVCFIGCVLYVPLCRGGTAQWHSVRGHLEPVAWCWGLLAFDVHYIKHTVMRRGKHDGAQQLNRIK